MRMCGASRGVRQVRIERGLSLIELLLAIGVLLVIIILAMPSFQSVVQNNRSIALSNEWVRAIQYARSEALQRSSIVSICPAQNNQYNSCGTNWNNGWIIFTNPNNDTVFNGSSDEQALRIQRAFENGESLTVQPSRSIISFNPRGFVSGAVSSTVFTITANGCSGNSGRAVTVLSTGKLDMAPSACS